MCNAQLNWNNNMEPTSSSVTSFAAYKLAIAYGIPTVLATVIVMLLTQPKSTREWCVALISTVASSIYGGAFLVRYLGYHVWLAEGESLPAGGLFVLGGLYLLCGLPAWILIRAIFAWTETRKTKDIGELVKDAKKIVETIKK